MVELVAYGEPQPSLLEYLEQSLDMLDFHPTTLHVVFVKNHKEVWKYSQQFESSQINDQLRREYQKRIVPIALFLNKYNRERDVPPTLIVNLQHYGESKLEDVILHELGHFKCEENGWMDEHFTAQSKAKMLYRLGLEEELIDGRSFIGIEELLADETLVRNGYENVVFELRKWKIYHLVVPPSEIPKIRESPFSSYENALLLAFESTLPPSFTNRGKIERDVFRPKIQNIIESFYPKVKENFESLVKFVHQIKVPPDAENIFEFCKNVYELHLTLPMF